MTMTLKILSRPFLRNYALAAESDFSTHQPYMGPVHCQIILTVDLKVMTFILKMFGSGLFLIES